MSVPSAPIIRVRPRSTYRSLEFWWAPPVSDGGSPITGYVLDCPSVYTNTYGPTDGYAIVADYLTYGTPYTFTIYATNANGNGAVATFRTVRQENPPVAPANPSFVRDASGVATVSWTAGYDISGSPIGWHLVTAYPIDASGTKVYNTTYGDQTTRVGGNFNPEKTYNLLVRARNDCAYSPATAWTEPLTFGITPTDISGLTVWLDAADVTTLFTDASGTIPILNNNLPIRCWKDKSPNAMSFVSNNPSYPVSRVYNGLNATYPCILANVQQNQMITTLNNYALSTSNAVTMFAVFDASGNGSTSGIFEALNIPIQLLITANGKGTGNELTQGIDGQNTFIVPNGPVLSYASCDPSDTYSKTYVPDIALETKSRLGNYLNTTTDARIFNLTGTNVSVKISEVLVYDGTLDATSVSRITEYLARKWGLTL